MFPELDPQDSDYPHMIDQVELAVYRELVFL